MNFSFLISILLGFGWLFAIAFGISLVVMGAEVGSRYVYSVSGLKRVGPSIGKSVGSTSFEYNGREVRLEEFISPTPTIIIFVDFRFMQGNLSIQLLPDLIKFTAMAKDELFCLVVVHGTISWTNPLANNHRNITTIVLNDADPPLLRKLGIRAVPYAVLVDEKAIVLSKGLVNQYSHLCYLVEESKSQISTSALQEISQNCQPYLDEMKRNSLTIFE